MGVALYKHDVCTICTSQISFFSEKTFIEFIAQISRFRRGTHGKLWPQLCSICFDRYFEKSLQNPRGFCQTGRFFLRKARFCVFYFSESRVFERWGLSRRSIGRFAPSFVLLNSLCFVSAWEPHTKVSVTYAIM